MTHPAAIEHKTEELSANAKNTINTYTKLVIN